MVAASRSSFLTQCRACFRKFTRIYRRYLFGRLSPLASPAIVVRRGFAFGRFVLKLLVEPGCYVKTHEHRAATETAAGRDLDPPCGAIKSTRPHARPRAVVIPAEMFGELVHNAGRGENVAGPTLQLYHSGFTRLAGVVITSPR